MAISIFVAYIIVASNLSELSLWCEVKIEIEVIKLALSSGP
jgi:hypothetical protein